MAQAAKKRGTRTPEQRVDGWANALTGIGTATRDKRMGTRLTVESVSDEEAEELVEGSDMAARIVEDPPGEMLRQGIRIRVDSNPEAAEAMNNWLDALDVVEALIHAGEDARAYGGAGILLGAMDRSKDMSLPLNEAALEDVYFLTELASTELKPVDWHRSSLAPKYGKPSVFEVREQSFGNVRVILPGAVVQPRVHESRMLVFQGTRLARKRQAQNLGWGGSVLVRCIQVLRDFEMSWGGAAHLLSDFSQAVMKFKGLTEMLETGHEDLIIKRAQLIDLSRSMARVVLLDEEEDFERKATPMSGLPEMLQQFALRLSAAARMPVTRLMGQSPAGLNATGDADIRAYYDHLASDRRRAIEPQLKRLVQLGFRCRGGPTKGKEPEKWSIEWPSMWQLTEGELADLRLKTAQADQIWVTTQVVTPAEVAVGHWTGDRFSSEIAIDLKARDGLTMGALPVDEASLELPPGAPASGPGAPSAPAVGKAADTALNGAQVTAAQSIVQSVVAGQLPRDTAINMLVEFFDIDQPRAERILGSVGKGFVPTSLEAAVPPVAKEALKAELAPAAPPPPGRGGAR